MDIKTCSFREFERLQQPDQVPVRTTVGGLRWAPSYNDRMVYSRLVTPRRNFVFPRPLPYDRYEEAYWRMLDAHGVDAINAELRRIGGGRDVVLLCFDDLSKPDGWCHRTMFGAWWTARTGQIVEELGRAYVAPTGGTAADPTLFDDIDGGA